MTYQSPREKHDEAVAKIDEDPVYYASLVGSPQQITWAANLRSKALAQLDEVLLAPELRDLIGGQKQASWWIERRGMIQSHQMQSICRALTGDESLVLMRRPSAFDYLDLSDIAKLPKAKT